MRLAGAGLRAATGTRWSAAGDRAAAQQSKQLRAAGAPPSETLFVLLMGTASPPGFGAHFCVTSSDWTYALCPW